MYFQCQHQNRNRKTRNKKRTVTQTNALPVMQSHTCVENAKRVPFVTEKGYGQQRHKKGILSKPKLTNGIYLRTHPHRGRLDSDGEHDGIDLGVPAMVKTNTTGRQKGDGAREARGGGGGCVTDKRRRQ